MRTLIARMALITAIVLPAVIAAQSSPSPSDPKAQFEIASMRRYDPNTRIMVMRMLPGRFEATGVTVHQLLRQALGGAQEYQVAGGPEWVNTERFVIAAKAPDGAPSNAMRTMLLNLLRDRFQLAIHSEVRELPVYNLVLARQDGRLGPALRPSAPECQAILRARASRPPQDTEPLPGTPGGPPLFDPENPQCGSGRSAPGILGGGGVEMAQLALSLMQHTGGRPVADKTGLKGLHDYTLRFRSDPALWTNPLGQPLPPISSPANPDMPDIFAAVQEQLGLKLESARAPVAVTVIDRIEKPRLD
jgi:uncharacterized protein (TIGR03435 family)